MSDTHIFKSHHDEETAQLRTRIAELEADRNGYRDAFAKCIERAEQAEAEVTATHDYAQGELERANKAEAELATERMSRQMYYEKWQQAEAENGRLRDDLTICRGADLAQLSVVMHKRAEQAEAELAALKAAFPECIHRSSAWHLISIRARREFDAAMKSWAARAEEGSGE